MDSPALIDTPKTAERTNLSVSFHNKARCTGTGPTYIKIGRRVLYRISDIDAWIAARTRRSTSEGTSR